VVRVAFRLDCCDRQVIRYVGTSRRTIDENIEGLLLESMRYQGSMLPAMPCARHSARNKFVLHPDITVDRCSPPDAHAIPLNSSL